MKPLLRWWRYAAVCSLLAGLPVYAACGASSASSSQDATESDDYQIEFAEMNSAWAGEEHDMKLPVRIQGVKNIKWSCDPAGAVDFDKGSKTGEAMIKIAAGGNEEVKIIATIGSSKTSAKLHITQSTAEIWQEGSDRYNNGTVFSWGGDRDGGGGGGRHDHDGGHREHTIDKKLACTNCHGTGSEDDDKVKHTPTQTAGYTDDDIKKIITEATKPIDPSTGEPYEQRVMKIEQWQKVHKWEMDDQQLLGIVTYLRSLAPQSQGAVDFPGQHLGMDHGKDKGGKSGGSSPTKSN